MRLITISVFWEDEMLKEAFFSIRFRDEQMLFQVKWLLKFQSNVVMLHALSLTRVIELEDIEDEIMLLT